MNNGFFEYNGYYGTAKNDDQGWYGKIRSKPNGEVMKDLVLYEAESFEDLKEEFVIAVEEYERQLLEDKGKSDGL